MKMIDEMRMDKTAFSVGDMRDHQEEDEYWHSRTPAERLIAMEQMRQILYGYDPATARLQRVLEIVKG